MKNNLILFLLLLISAIPYMSFSQQLPECGTPHAGGSGTENYACLDENIVRSLPSSGCDDYTKYSPLDARFTPIRTVRLVFHVFQKSDGTRNFQNTANDIQLLDQMLAAVNSVYSNVKTLTPNGEPCISEELPDSRIRFERHSEIFFHQDSDAWIAGDAFETGYHGCDVFDDYVETSSLPEEIKENSIHVLFVGKRPGPPNPIIGGYSAGIPTGSNGRNFILLKGLYYHGVELNQNWVLTNWWEVGPYHLAHELGHALGLFHAYSSGSNTLNDYCCDTKVNNNTVLGTGWGQDKMAFSECQIARMNYFLEKTDHPNQVVYKANITDYCNKDVNNPVVIQNGETIEWDVDKKLTSDIIIESGGRVDCTLQIRPPYGCEYPCASWSPPFCRWRNHNPQ